MTTETYIETTLYCRAVGKIADLKPCPFTGKIDEDWIKTILGEEADIWPENIRADVERAARIDAEIDAKNVRVRQSQE